MSLYIWCFRFSILILETLKFEQQCSYMQYFQWNSTFVLDVYRSFTSLQRSTGLRRELDRFLLSFYISFDIFSCSTFCLYSLDNRKTDYKILKVTHNRSNDIYIFSNNSKWHLDLPNTNETENNFPFSRINSSEPKDTNNVVFAGKN